MTSKNSAAPIAPTGRIATKQIPLAELETWPGNPRRGDIAAIRESLKRNGQYRAIVVRTKTMQVLAGNHTLLAMRELEWTRALCHLIDVDEDQARRIVLADNRTADLGGYDDQALADLLSTLDGDLEGTGWDQGALEDLIASLEPIAEPSAEPAEIEETFDVLVSCASEIEQTQLLERLTEEGLACRALLS